MGLSFLTILLISCASIHLEKRGNLRDYIYSKNHLAEGGIAYVFEAYPKVDKKRKLVIKVAADSFGWPCLENEAKFLDILNSDPNATKIINLFDSFHVEKKPLLVLEYVKGNNLKNYAQLHRQGILGGKSKNLWQQTFLEMAMAVRDVHAHNVCHRDIKV